MHFRWFTFSSTITDERKWQMHNIILVQKGLSLTFKWNGEDPNIMVVRLWEIFCVQWKFTFPYSFFRWKFTFEWWASSIGLTYSSICKEMISLNRIILITSSLHNNCLPVLIELSYTSFLILKRKRGKERDENSSIIY